jgi:hypothetical protein
MHDLLHICWRVVVSIMIATMACVSVDLSAQSASASQNVKRSFSLTIAPPQPTIKAGSKVLVEVTMENKSDHDLALTFSEWDMDVWDEKGEMATETRYRRILKGHENAEDRAGPRYVIGGKSIDTTLDRGKSFTNRVNVSEMYDLSRPGKYEIQFNRYDDESKSVVTSNKITVTVTP